MQDDNLHCLTFLSDTINLVVAHVAGLFSFPPFEAFQPVEGYFLLYKAARKDIKANYV